MCYVKGGVYLSTAIVACQTGEINICFDKGVYFTGCRVKFGDDRKGTNTKHVRNGILEV